MSLWLRNNRLVLGERERCEILFCTIVPYFWKELGSSTRLERDEKELSSGFFFFIPEQGSRAQWNGMVKRRDGRVDER